MDDFVKCRDGIFTSELDNLCDATRGDCDWVEVVMHVSVSLVVMSGCAWV